MYSVHHRSHNYVVRFFRGISHSKCVLSVFFLFTVGQLHSARAGLNLGPFGQKMILYHSDIENCGSKAL